jgi:hypothetical protein
LVRFIFSLATTLTLASGQTPDSADPVSGMWKGDMAPTGETNRQSFTMELRFDGKSGVSGTVQGPTTVPIKAGIFDPKSGRLKLDVEVRAGVPFAFDGKLQQGTISGSVSGANKTGDFRMTRSDAQGSVTTQSDQNEATAAARRGFISVSDWVTKAADLVPAERYGYRPVPAVRSFGQLVAHVADSYLYYCGRAAGRNVTWADAIEKGPTDKATVVQKLRQSLDACRASGDTVHLDAWIENLAHTSLHYGNMITYLRLLGLTPPSN